MTRKKNRQNNSNDKENNSLNNKENKQNHQKQPQNSSNKQKITNNNTINTSNKPTKQKQQTTENYTTNNKKTSKNNKEEIEKDFTKNHKKNASPKTPQKSPLKYAKRNRKILHKISRLLQYTIFLLFLVGILLIVLIYEESFFGTKNMNKIQKTISTQIQSIKEINEEYWNNFFTLLPVIQLYEPSRPGQLLKLVNNSILDFPAHAKYPVVILPGVVSTKLEVWESKDCAKHSFRTQYWGSSSMLQSMILKPKCWLEHISLNLTTGLDPDHIKLRPMSGFDAADFLIGDYYIWARVIQNLADVGYDTNSIHMASYDWRLSFQNLEKRDFYFTKLKTTIEILKLQNNNNKVVILAHSMGSIVFQYFLQWVESDQGGKGGSSWVDQNIQSYVNIGGPILGVPKAASALISGEMRDTADLHSVLDYIKENFISRTELLSLFRSFWSLASMLPKGGERVWGGVKGAADEIISSGDQMNPGKLFDFDESFSPSNSYSSSFISSNSFNVSDEDHSMEIFKLRYEECDQDDELNDHQITFDHEKVNSLISQKAISIEGYLDLMRTIASPYMEKIDSILSFDLATNFSDPKYEENSKYWANPLESQLPNAPEMKIFSLYGINKATERSYFYKQNKECDEEIPFTLNKHLTDDQSNIYHGVHVSDGDGTVPLLSLGFMSVKGWKSEKYNPYHLTCITKEYEHKPQSTLEAGGDLGARLRGGSTTADHVDILGNSELLMDILLIATGNEDRVQDRIYSKIREIADQIDL